MNGEGEFDVVEAYFCLTACFIATQQQQLLTGLVDISHSYLLSQDLVFLLIKQRSWKEVFLFSAGRIHFSSGKYDPITY